MMLYADRIKPEHIFSRSLVKGVEMDGLKMPFPNLPEKYLGMAIGHRRQKNHIDAVANAKRCATCRVDCLLYSFGLLPAARRNKWKFQTKVAVLNKLGFDIPGILSRNNAVRNLVEYEYKEPGDDAALTAIDTANLFLQSSDNYTIGGILSITIERRKKRFELKLDRNRGYIRIVNIDDKSDVRIVPYSDDTYKEWLKQILKLHKKIIQNATVKHYYEM